MSTTLAIRPDAAEYERLHAAYREPQRAYHTLQHLGECLQQLDRAKTDYDGRDAALAEIALWYHDAVYRPRAGDNERRSADWAAAFLASAGLGEHDRALVRSLVMATCHGERPQQALHQLVVDVDLSILGANPARFAEYERQVRREYRWVPWFLYKKKRAEVLQHFLAAPRIYSSERFYRRYERRARDNLQRSLAKLAER